MPVHTQTGRDGTNLTTPAVFEIKTMQLNLSNYGVCIYSEAQKPAERRGTKVASSYRRRLEAADRKYAKELVSRDGATGPFVQALQRIATKNVIPLVTGWFGETNGQLDQLLIKLAKITANGPQAIGMSPLDNSDRNGGAFPIILQRMRRGLACVIARGNARHIQSRIHFLRRNKTEAHNIWKAHKRENRWRPGQYGRHSAFCGPTASGYDEFEQFLNGRHYKSRL